MAAMTPGERLAQLVAAEAEGLAAVLGFALMDVRERRNGVRP